ncbi:MAG: hypothetical protein AAGF66_01730 [Cyanobacteria bacterium P01_H01_bin.119]
MTYNRASRSSTLQSGSSKAHRAGVAHARWKSTPQSTRIIANLCLNAAWVLLAVGLVFGLNTVIAAVVNFRQSDVNALSYLHWLTAFVTLSSVVVYALQDLMKALDTSLWMPFQYSLNKVSGIYWQRFQVFLLAIAFDVLLIALCSAFPTMSFVSHFFLASVFSLTIFAVRKSVPIAKYGFFSAVGIFLAALTTIFVTLFFVGTPEEDVPLNEGEATEMLNEAERQAEEGVEADEEEN